MPKPVCQSRCVLVVTVATTMHEEVIYGRRRLKKYEMIEGLFASPIICIPLSRACTIPFSTSIFLKIYPSLFLVLLFGRFSVINILKPQILSEITVLWAVKTSLSYKSEILCINPDYTFGSSFAEIAGKDYAILRTVCVKGVNHFFITI